VYGLETMHGAFRDGQLGLPCSRKQSSQHKPNDFLNYKAGRSFLLKNATTDVSSVLFLHSQPCCFSSIKQAILVYKFLSSRQTTDFALHS